MDINMTTLKALAAISLGLALSLTSNAATQKTTKDIKLSSCTLDTQSSINLCNAKNAANIKKLSNQKPNFGENSILLRFWDTEMNYWVYLAVNKKTNQAFYYPRGLRSSGEDSRDVKINFSGSKICTSGDQVDIVGDEESSSFEDYETDVDYCVDYDPENGFGVTYQIDPKTRKLIRYTGI